MHIEINKKNQFYIYIYNEKLFVEQTRNISRNKLAGAENKTCIAKNRRI